MLIGGSIIVIGMRHGMRLLKIFYFFQVRQTYIYLKNLVMNELKKRGMLALAAAMYVKEAPIVMELINLNLGLEQGMNVENRLIEIEDDLILVMR